MPQPPKDLRSLDSLIQIVADLRGPEGCPWDKEQTHQSLTPYAVEETAELVEAIESKDDGQTKEELGDVLFQVVLHSQLAQERGAFSFMDVLETLNQKMVRRHPHVFG
ncbi:MAG TPA: MazG nucleotide pyrophosphohydrolase domain-containing protein, partial [Pseudobdellovibrionaceae bacterium]|nr:MazG nucleotide pyrophosphohydrolase domain-containing protein [Pseudobdellovibrionaceae bacterium]